MPGSGAGDQSLPLCLGLVQEINLFPYVWAWCRRSISSLMSGSGAGDQSLPLCLGLVQEINLFPYDWIWYYSRVERNCKIPRQELTGLPLAMTAEDGPNQGGKHHEIPRQQINLFP